MFLGRVRQPRGGTPTNRTSALLVLAVLFGSMLLQVPVAFLRRLFQEPWLAAWIFGPLAAAAVFAYALMLRNAERLILGAPRRVCGRALQGVGARTLTSLGRCA